MVRRARRNPPRPPARRGGAELYRALRLPPYVNGYRAFVTDPHSGASSNDRTPQITVVGYNEAPGGTVDLQVEWRRQLAIETTPGNWSPAATYTVSIPDVVNESPTFTEPPTDLAYGTWYVRVRAGNADTNFWGGWSTQVWLDVRPRLGSFAQYIDMNVGLEPPPLAGTVAYIEMNVGVDPAALDLNLAAYAEMNVGVEPTPMGATAYTDLNVGPNFGALRVAAYTDFNAVTDETPIPHIWWIRPEQGKEGFVFNIYGQGFGAFQGEFDGRVMLGALQCSISRWEIVPPELLATTIRVSGQPRTTSSTTSLPTVLLNTATSVVFAEGDIIEYDLLWEVPSSSRLDIFPVFDVSGNSSSKMGYGSALLNDTTGDAWISDQPEAYGSWHHRRFVIPPGHFLIGKTANNFGVGWYGFDAGSPVRTGAIRSFVIRASDETAKLWVTGDDEEHDVLMTYVANTGALTFSELDRETHEIIHAPGLGPDTITPEHGWIVAIVPSGAVSSMVKVVLEDD